MAREIPLLQEIITSIIDSNRYKNNTNDLNILDLGCGPGKHIQELSSLFPDISFLGIDIDPEMIKSALDKNKNNLRVDFAIGDIFNRDFSLLSI